MEKKYGFIESAINKRGGRNKFFYLGPKNKWQEKLSSEIRLSIEKKFENEMKELGYI